MALVAVVGLLALAGLGADAIGKQIGASGFRIYLGGPPAGHFGGNFARQLPLTEGLGVWLGRDFRLPADGTGATPAVLLAICVFVAAIVLDRRRWRSSLLLPSAFGVLIYLVARRTTLPYFSAKLLISLGPLLILFAMSALLEAGSTERQHGARRLAPVVLASAFAALVIWSGADALRSSPVDGTAFASELSSLRGMVTGHSVLFLGADQWAPEWLRGSNLRGLNAGHRYPVRQAKRAGPPWDFDTPRPALLDSIDYVIAPRTLDASEPPPNWRLVRTTAHYQLFARDGTAPRRFVLDEQAAPGARLDCSLPAARALAAKPGVAAVRAAPIVSGAWLTRRGSSAFGPGRARGGVPDRGTGRHLEPAAAGRDVRAVTDVLERRARDPARGLRGRAPDPDARADRLALARGRRHDRRRSAAADGHDRPRPRPDPAERRLRRPGARRAGERPRHDRAVARGLRTVRGLVPDRLAAATGAGAVTRRGSRGRAWPIARGR